MRKKTGLIVLAVMLALLLGLGLWINISFNGSLLKKLILTKQAEQYVLQNYPGEDLDVDFAGYDFKMCGYYCDVHKNSGGDYAFMVYRNSDGNLTDDFELRVLQKENTILRLGRALDDDAETFIKENFPHRTTLAYCGTTGEITDDVRGSLRLDMPYVRSEYPLPCEMGVWAETAGDAPSWEEAAERLKELRALTKDTFPFVTKYHLGIQNRYVETDGGWEPEDYGAGVYVFDVPAEVIDDETALADWLMKERLRQETENSCGKNRREETLEKGEEI